MESDCGLGRDAAAYVLGNLHGRALADFERHRRACRQCQDDVDLLQRAADSVPLLASAPPKKADMESGEPEWIRPGVWAHERIQSVTAPKPPTLREQIAARAAGSKASQAGRRAGGWWQQQVTKPAMAGVVGLAVLAIIVLILTKQGQSINYVDAKIAWQNGAGVLKMQGSQGQLLVVGMPAPPADESYQVWAVEKGVRTEIPLAARLMLNAKGEGGTAIPGDIHHYVALAVYAEPASGATSPNGTPYVVADLRRANKK